MEKKLNQKIDSLLKGMPCVGSSAVLFNDKVPKHYGIALLANMKLLI